MEQMADIRDWGGRFVVADPGGPGVSNDLPRDPARRAPSILEPERLEDERGFFARTCCRERVRTRAG